MKFCPSCIELDVKPVLIDDDDNICGYCFDTEIEMEKLENSI